jgi:Na+-translocating ferredoxin:NAD+ oxidoreductase subunit C
LPNRSQHLSILTKRKVTGIRLERKKEASLLNWNLKRPYPPEKLHIPIAPFAAPRVKIGEVVQIGQKIAEPQGPKGVSVHAGMPGVVEKIAAMPDALGRESLMIAIHKHGEPKTLPPPETRKEWEQIPAEELLKIFQHSGLVTTDPHMEPVHAKIGRHAGAQTIIINGCEPEPYVTCEQVLAMSHPLEILKGAELLKKAAGAERILFAIENCNLEMIELIRSKIYFLKWEHVEVRTVPALYPQGLESTLLQAWFTGEEEKAIVFPASTAFAVYEAIVQNKPFYERVVTVGGECVVEPRSLWLPIGISFHDAIHACKGVMREPQKILMGGPMAGTAQQTAEIPVMAGTNAILALPKEVVNEETEEPCIRCNACVDHCPVSLSPAMITLAAERKEFAIAEEWNVAECIECGNCAYVCPSRRPMLELIRLALPLSRTAVTHG